MADFFKRLLGLYAHSPAVKPDRRPAPLLPVQVAVGQRPARTPPPLKGWSHPFKDRRDPLLQLTQMGKAAAGYFPLGRNGLWHGGVHFDGGTAGTLDQSSVHCLADGEVVAYRVDTHSPTTSYLTNEMQVSKPFSRSFVLVRHCLQAPAIEGHAGTPPCLYFYSLYMHLQDGAAYQEDPNIARPAYWPQPAIYRVSSSVKDVLTGRSAHPGLNVRNSPNKGKVLDLLPRGAEVVISGEGDYRKLEGVPGPSSLLDADGLLLGYVNSHSLIPNGKAGYYRANNRDSVDVRAEASLHAPVIGQLPPGTEVQVSGEGTFRKLSYVSQYVHFKSLEGDRQPQAHDCVVVPDQAIVIKAAELIGHLGCYQDAGADRPEQKLHLEVFTDDPMEDFLQASRAWAQGLPAHHRTWLKLAKGTPVVAHQGHFSAKRPPSYQAALTHTGADLWVPKVLLDGLPKDKRIVATHHPREGKAYTWYYLEGLLHDKGNNLVDGWVCEEVGITPWVSPWAWDGFGILYNYETAQESLAFFERAAGRFNETQLQRFGPMADRAAQGVLRNALHTIIDPDRNGQISAQELQTATSLPGHAQAISQLIILAQSEWYHPPQKWDMLDELLGHSGSTPHRNWLAEKERIKALSWWGEVAGKVGLASDGKAYHFHPIGLLAHFSADDDSDDLKWLTVPFGQLTFDVEGNDVDDEKNALYRYFSRVAHWPGGASGVTIGRGYDLGQRPDPEADLRAVGIQEPLLSWLIGAKGLKGEKARIYYLSRPAAVRVQKITRKQQYKLFIPVYESMKFEISRVSSQKYNRERYGMLDWDVVSTKIRDIMIDLIYRGDYGVGSRVFIQRPFVESDLSAFIEVMSARGNWNNVPSDRFQRRVRYLNK